MNVDTFVITTQLWGDEIHHRGAVACPECSYPAARACPAPDCTGVVHFYDYDESPDGETQWCSSICDGCGKGWDDLTSRSPY